MSAGKASSDRRITEATACESDLPDSARWAWGWPAIAAEAHRTPMPLASLLRDHLLLAQGGDAQDWSAIGRLAARNAGL